MKNFACLVSVMFISGLTFAAPAVQPKDVPAKNCVPHFENGQPAGQTCSDPDATGTFEKIGLKNGDTLHSVDGQPVNTPESAFKHLNRKSKKVNISRNGKRKTIDMSGNIPEIPNR